MKSGIKTLIAISGLTIAFGYMEASVVVYLRALYYPNGFDFPLASMSPVILSVELGRELATLVILATLGYLTGKTAGQRFAWFLYAFAMWDIFYYVFLKLWLNWPAQWLTWDVLVLLPTTWVGPVLAPLLVSFTMVGLAGLILCNEQRNRVLRFRGIPVVLLVLGAAVVFLCFIGDYSGFILEHFSPGDLFNPASFNQVADVAYRYVPRHFMWGWFAGGEVLVLAGGCLAWYRRVAVR